MTNIVEMEGLSRSWNDYLNVPFETSYVYEDFKAFYEQSRQEWAKYDDEKSTIAFSNQILLTVSNGSATFCRWSEKQ